MPIYEYRCDACGHELEALQKISDPTLTDCPSCGKPELKKLLSAPGFRLKGGGWYETDFKKDGKKNLHEGSSEGPKESSKEPAKPAASNAKPAATSSCCSGGACAG